MTMISRVLNFFKKSALFRRFELYLTSKINDLASQKFEEKLGAYMWANGKINNQSYVIKVLENNYLLKCYFDSNLAETIFTAQFEQEEIRFMTKYLEKGGVFIDVGANIGLFSLYASHKLKDKGHVYSFEPTQKTFDRLLENIEINGISNITSFKEALSDANGEANLNTVLDGYDAWNSFGTPTNGASFSVETVKTITLDEFALQNNIVARDIRLIKIDVEGWELPVIKGGRLLLSQPDAPVLLVEFTEENARSAGFNCQDLYKIVEEFGYSWFKFERDKLVPASIQPYFSYQNLVATKQPKLLLEHINNA